MTTFDKQQTAAQIAEASALLVKAAEKMLLHEDGEKARIAIEALTRAQGDLKTAQDTLFPL